VEEDEEDEEDMYVRKPAAGGAAQAGGAMDASLGRPIESQTDPNAWRIEARFLPPPSGLGGSRGGPSTPTRLQRALTGPRGQVENVAPMLKMRAEADNKEWRTHLESTKELQGSIEGKVPNTKEHLDKLSKGINGDMEQISTREKHINAQYKELVLSYQEVQDGLQKTTNDYETHNAAVSEVKDQLAQISEELEQIRSQMDERGESMTDTGPLVRIKDAMKKAPHRAPRPAPRAPPPPPAAGGPGVTARGADR
jgi:archaellum component FlaC